MSAVPPSLRGGHELALLEGSRTFFPALIDAIDQARTWVRFETYIFDFTGSGIEVAHALERAARRGVHVTVAVDGVGSEPLAPVWLQRFEESGVQWRVYSPLGRSGLLWPGQWRRLHRKLVEVDGHTAFCGGINVLDDFHDPNHGVLDHPRFDFSVRVRGPLVADVSAAMEQLWRRMQATAELRQVRLIGALVSLRDAVRDADVAGPRATAQMQGQASAALLLRDNVLYRGQIEKAYRRAIVQAKSDIIIANAYFVPGRKMRSALVHAARRGVKVQLLLQGRYEYFMQYYAARPVYEALLKAGVEIHEYAPSFLHAKVAVVDGRWATVGSSNLDPLSLLLAREANIVVDDAAFGAQLRDRLRLAMHNEGRRMDPERFANRPLYQRFFERVALGLMRLALAVQGKKYL